MHTSRRCTLLRNVLCVCILFIGSDAAGSRQLRTESCRTLVAGCGVDRCYYSIVGSSSIATCPRCLGILYRRNADGTRCDCIPGTYASCSSGVCQCIRCPRDSWCPGGLNSNNVRPTSTYDSTAAAGLSAAVAVPCGQGLTTRLGVVARYSSQCVSLPGWGAIFRNATVVAPCAVGTYSSGGRSARVPCTRCPSGFTTRTTGATQRNDCVASPGLYVDMGLVKPCPAGHYQPNFTMGYSEVCLPCPTGVTTATSAATAASDCAVALPGYGITTCGSGEACQAETCPVGYYNAGGVGSSSCIRCPYGMTTQNNGSSGEALCLVPPGHGLVLPLPADTSSNRVQPCVFGYNTGWNRAACTSCGVNVTSLNNRTSEADCFVLRGQGLQMMRDPVLGTVRTALDCWVGSIGMSEDTPVRLAKPCDTCPRDMTTLGVRSSNRSECIALPGYTVQEIPELNITVAVPCAQGSYKGGLGNEACTPCPSNTNTPSVGATSITQCTVCQAGWGGWSSTGGSPAGPSCGTRCPVGTWNDGNYASCQSCPSNTTTVITGAISVDNCTVCLPSFGNWNATGPSCSSRCSPGTFNNGSFATCQPCPTGFTPSSDASSCVPLPPPPSPSPSPSPPPPPTATCTQRPVRDESILPACPTGGINSDGAFEVQPPGNAGNRPPGCLRRSGQNCQLAGGQLMPNTNFDRVHTSEGVLCVCQEWRKGFMLQPVNSRTGLPDPNGNNDKLGCVANIIFLPLDPNNFDGAGVWARDTILGSSCSNPQECWDMCFHCDGTVRYNANQQSADREGRGIFRGLSNSCNFTTCQFNSNPPENRSWAFDQACQAFASGASRQNNLNLPLFNGLLYPYRPEPVTSALVLPRPVPGGSGVNRGQTVMLSFQMPTS